MKKVFAVIGMAVLTALSACGNTDDVSLDDVQNYIVEDGDTTSISETSQSGEYGTDISVEIKKSDVYFDYKTRESVTVALSDDSAECASDLVDIRTGKIVIKGAGVYVLKGQYTGTVSVEAQDTDKVYIVLDNASVKAPSGPAICASLSEKTIILLPPGTVNSLSDSQIYNSLYGDKITAALYSKENLTITGSGTLNVTGYYKDGITTKDKLKIIGSTVNVTAADDGIVGKDLLYISEATVTVSADDDGLKASNEKSADKGSVLLEKSTVTVNAGNDALKAVNSICISDTVIVAQASDKGIKSDHAITVNGGDVTVSSPYIGLDSPIINIGSDGHIYVCSKGSGNRYAFDCSQKFTLEGAEVIASDVTEMFLPSNDVTSYPKLDYTLATSVTGGSVCEITGSGMSESFTAVADFDRITVISDAFKTGDSYTLSAGGISLEAVAQ